LQNDLVGTVRSSTTDSGSAEYYEYDVFGKPYGESVSDYAYTGKPYDPTTGMYNYGYRDYVPQTARFSTVDPIRDGNNWFAYCNNEPVNWVDMWGLSASDRKGIPEGRTSVDEIQQQISAVQQQYAGIFNSDAYDTSEGQGKLANLLGQLTDLYGQYNNAVISQGNLNIQDYIQGGVLTGGFDEAQGLTGNYQTNFHCGVDGVGGYAKTPFYTSIIGADDGRSNSLTLDIIGTGLHMQILHGDEGSFMRSGGSFSPGQKIMPFPKLNNSPESSTAPHFHFQIANGSQFISPFTMKASSTLFKYTNNGGKTWSNFRTDF